MRMLMAIFATAAIFGTRTIVTSLNGKTLIDWMIDWTDLVYVFHDMIFTIVAIFFAPVSLISWTMLELY